MHATSRIFGTLFYQLAKTIQTNKQFFLGYHLLLLAGLYPLLAYDKVSLFLTINRHHHALMDYFFYYFTHLGNGITYCLLMVVIAWGYRSLQLGLLGMVCFGTMSVIVQCLKRLVFSDQLRPIKLVALTHSIEVLHMVDKDNILTHLSFPSGHAATIFSAACLLSVVTPWKNSIIYNVLLLAIASLVAYSRIYLCQHFYTDVYVGAWIGGWSVWLVQAWLSHTPLFLRIVKKLPNPFWKKNI